MLKLLFIAYLAFMCLIVFILPGCESAPTTTVEGESKFGILTWEFRSERYIIECIGPIDTVFWEGNEALLPIGSYWIGVEPDCDSGTSYYSFNVEIEEGKVVDLGEEISLIQNSL